MIIRVNLKRNLKKNLIAGISVNFQRLILEKKREDRLFIIGDILTRKRGKALINQRYIFSINY